MTLSKILVLGVDGLEYNLVIRWKLKNLMQETFGSIILSQEYMINVSPVWSKTREEVPYTPIVWTSFLTGKKPYEHGITKMQTYNSVLEWIRKLPVISWIKNKRRLFWKLGIKPKVIDKNEYKYSTIFEECKPSKAIWFITYNEPTWIWEKLEYTATYLGKKYDVRDLVNIIWEIYDMRLENLYNEIEHNWKLLGAYFETLDWLGHLFYGKSKLKLHKAYVEFDKMVGKLRNSLDCKILIVSDHGMQLSEDGVTGNHSNHNFWSVNFNTHWKPNDITDYYPKILEWCS